MVFTKDKMSKILKDAEEIISNWIEYVSFFKKIPGISIGVVHGNNIIFTKHCGYANIASKKPVTDETCYRIASISKLFTAISLMQLVEQEKLQLDDPVSKYLQWFNSNKLNKITIRQLLMHCSGLIRDGTTDHWQSLKFPEIDVIKQEIQNSPTAYSVLENWKYSNFGYAILGEVIHEVSGLTYEEYVEKNIINRLGLQNTAPNITDKISNQLATGYGRNIPGLEREIFSTAETGAYVSAAGFSSNVIDLCKFISSQFDDNDILLKSTSKKEMRRTQWVRKQPGGNWGVGYQILKIKDFEVYMHSGGFPGYITCIGLHPEYNIGVVALTNSFDGSAPAIMQSIFQMIFTLIQKYDAFTETKTKRKLNDYVGRYSCTWADIDVKIVNNSLVYYESGAQHPLEYPAQLVHVKNDEFLIVGAEDSDYIGETIKFIFDDNGKVTKIRIGPNTWHPATFIKANE